MLVGINLALNDNVLLDLHVDVSSAEARLALSSLSLTRLEIDTHRGDFQADLSGDQPALAAVDVRSSK